MRNTFINPQTQLEMKTDPPMQLVLLRLDLHWNDATVLEEHPWKGCDFCAKVV